MWCDLAENRLDSGLFSFEISLPDYLDPRRAFHPPLCIPSLPSSSPSLLPAPSYPLSPLSRQRIVPRNASKEITGRFISLCLGHESRIVSENWPSSFRVNETPRRTSLVVHVDDALTRRRISQGRIDSVLRSERRSGLAITIW